MAVSMRLNPKEDELLRAYAAIHGQSVSDVLRNAAMEKIQNEYDLKAYEQSLEDYQSDSNTSTLDELEMYEVRVTEKAKLALKVMDPSVVKLILAWMRKNLDHCKNPYALGEDLVLGRKDERRFQIGDCHVLAKIEGMEIIILHIKMSYQNEIYGKKE